MLANFQNQFASLTVGGLSLGFIYVLIALGYTMVYGVLRMINFANSEIFMYGTFASIVVIRDVFKFTQQSEPATGFRLIYILLFCLIGSMLMAGVLSVFLELVAYRRLRNKGSNKLAPLISAIGMSIVLAEFMRILTDSRYVGSPRVMEKKVLGNFFGAELRLDNVIIVVAGLILFIGLSQFVDKTRLGKAIRAVSMNEDAAKLMGVNLNFVVSGTFLVGGLMTGAAGFFYILKYENTSFNIGFELGIAAFTAAILGGIGNIKGAFYGGIALGLLETYASFFLGTQWKAVTVFLVLVVVLYFRPNGVFGEAITQTRA
ncbi:MAG: branched-chain amino acid ABC transporter permease [Actinobacteria bacterium]|nr:branched-chain amino acid ABC transporter permease [Actinomycetota bacterium]NCU77746.1 branched-chain amino acid ABC transporter permease [Actinomycetota bacterium]NCU96897.1 branched-chain amino acid ABC transporter permease [Actinomycetota bacterium]NCZ76478.1 branched-chain amino acid ABC transporter permease [Actinomycetota bacterium]